MGAYYRCNVFLVLQEIPENGADAAHLNQVHQPFLAAGYDLNTMWNKYISWGKHVWEASWSQRPSPDEHVGCMDVTHELKIFGCSLRLFKLNVRALQVNVHDSVSYPYSFLYKIF